MRPTIMEVNLDNFRYNINSIKSKLADGAKIMPVIKANAYGTYINTRLDILNEFDIVAVALVDEGINLRNIGYEKEIFILNQPDIAEVDDILKYNLTIGICDDEFVKSIGEREGNVKVHIEIETGMGRTGVHLNKICEFINLIKQQENIKIDGLYTHLSSADTDEEYTKNQIKKFDEAIKIVKIQIPNLKYIHSLASNGIVNFSESQYNLVRPGITIYGFESGENIFDKIDLKPICRLKSKITFLKTVNKGTSIGYSRKYVTDKETKIATIPIGYADGLRRDLSNKGEVVINGRKAPIIGNVCMDSIMVDVSDIPDAKVGDDIWIWDNENIKLEDIAQKCNTINYEIMSTISNRVQRVFK